MAESSTVHPLADAALGALSTYEADFAARLDTMSDESLARLCRVLRRSIPGPGMREPDDVRAWGHGVAMEAAERRGVRPFADTLTR